MKVPTLEFVEMVLWLTESQKTIHISDRRMEMLMDIAEQRFNWPRRRRTSARELDKVTRQNRPIPVSWVDSRMSTNEMDEQSIQDERAN